MDYVVSEAHELRDVLTVHAQSAHHGPLNIEIPQTVFSCQAGDVLRRDAKKGEVVLNGVVVERHGDIATISFGGLLGQMHFLGPGEAVSLGLSIVGRASKRSITACRGCDEVQAT